ncbi:MAG TPA: GNAT family N-acetyltransferase [Candidatus Limnocylindria bacterium]|jgi:CelD/BcsL family acetyltransferase involved in cellulose biosynthesis|nr:GNAT family N-acetyltransferase [Candidatus Limnocylindria bacterium]
MILTTSDPSCIARDPASLEAEWSELARRRAEPSIFLTPEWLAVTRAYDRRRQTTLSIGPAGARAPGREATREAKRGATGIAALAHEDDGTITFAGGEFTDEQDVIAAPSDAAEVAQALGGWIAAQRAPRVRLEYVPEDVPTAGAIARALAPHGYDVQVERLITSPRLHLPADFAVYVQSLTKKERHELRRKIRRLETGRRVAFRIAQERERAAVLDRFVALHRRSRGEKAEFMTADRERYFRDVADAVAAPGWLRLGVLEVDGEDVAVLYAFAYEGTLSLYNAAYDPTLAPLSVGIVCHAYAIRSAIAEGIRTYDLLRGDEPYKYDLGAVDRWLVRIEAARP